MSYILKPEPLLFLALAMVCLTGCGPAPESGTESAHSDRASDPSLRHSATFIAFGTAVSITLDGLDADQANELLGTSNRMLMDWHHRWHPWKHGEITRLNDAISKGQSLVLEADTVELLEAARQLSMRSEGYFNPAIGGLVSMWGFHTDDYPVTSPIPKAHDIDTWLRGNPQMSDLVIEGLRVLSRNPLVRIDTGAVAKGLAVDQLLALYRQAAVPAALINAGGDLRGYGKQAGAWQIAIRHPREGGVLAGIEMIGDEALFTSGNYSRFKQVAGERYSHILDPKTGWPVDRIISATVVANSGLVADAAATALVVAPPEQTLRLMQQFELSHVLLVDDHGCVRVDAALLQRLHWQHGPPDCLTVIDPVEVSTDITDG